ncbi:DUF3710 domain-containing protein [Kitasatospora sp. NPDC092286]
MAEHGLSEGEVETMVEALCGDLSAVRKGRRSELFSLRNILAILVVLLGEESIHGEDIDFLLGGAEEIADGFLRADDPFRLVERGVEIGPWDASEAGWQGTDLVDLGGLRIPRDPGLKIQVNEGRGSSDLLEAVVLRGSTGVQLQAFHVTQEGAWARAREKFAQNVRGLGGEAREWAGRAGVELRCEIPVEQSPGVRGPQTVRVLGFEGPGWLLRGIVTGEGADPASQDEWAYSYVERVVVDPSFRKVPDPLLSPAGFGSLQPSSDSPILLRMPK